jgi:hypothetical protein
MKSLEIVNEKIAETIHPRCTYTETIWDEEIIINKNELEQIKQDLEVLEILRKYRIDLIGLDNEDYNKLKQWLEGNE